MPELEEARIDPWVLASMPSLFRDTEEDLVAGGPSSLPPLGLDGSALEAASAAHDPGVALAACLERYRLQPEFVSAVLGEVLRGKRVLVLSPPAPDGLGWVPAVHSLLPPSTRYRIAVCSGMVMQGSRRLRLAAVPHSDLLAPGASRAEDVVVCRHGELKPRDDAFGELARRLVDAALSGDRRSMGSLWRRAGYYPPLLGEPRDVAPRPDDVCRLVEELQRREAKLVATSTAELRRLIGEDWRAATDAEYSILKQRKMDDCIEECGDWFAVHPELGEDSEELDLVLDYLSYESARDGAASASLRVLEARLRQLWHGELVSVALRLLGAVAALPGLAAEGRRLLVGLATSMPEPWAALVGSEGGDADVEVLFTSLRVGLHSADEAVFLLDGSLAGLGDDLGAEGLVLDRALELLVPELPAAERVDFALAVSGRAVFRHREVTSRAVHRVFDLAAESGADAGWLWERCLAATRTWAAVGLSAGVIREKSSKVLPALGLQGRTFELVWTAATGEDVEPSWRARAAVGLSSWLPTGGGLRQSVSEDVAAELVREARGQLSIEAEVALLGRLGGSVGPDICRTWACELLRQGAHGVVGAVARAGLAERMGRWFPGFTDVAEPSRLVVELVELVRESGVSATGLSDPATARAALDHALTLVGDGAEGRGLLLVLLPSFSEAEAAGMAARTIAAARSTSDAELMLAEVAKQRPKLAWETVRQIVSGPDGERIGRPLYSALATYAADRRRPSVGLLALGAPRKQYQSSLLLLIERVLPAVWPDVVIAALKDWGIHKDLALALRQVLIEANVFDAGRLAVAILEALTAQRAHDCALWLAWSLVSDSAGGQRGPVFTSEATPWLLAGLKDSQTAAKSARLLETTPQEAVLALAGQLSPLDLLRLVAACSDGSGGQWEAWWTPIEVAFDRLPEGTETPAELPPVLDMFGGREPLPLRLVVRLATVQAGRSQRHALWAKAAAADLVRQLPSGTATHPWLLGIGGSQLELRLAMNTLESVGRYVEEASQPLLLLRLGGALRGEDRASLFKVAYGRGGPTWVKPKEWARGPWGGELELLRAGEDDSFFGKLVDGALKELLPQRPGPFLDRLLTRLQAGPPQLTAAVSGWGLLEVARQVAFDRSVTALLRPERQQVLPARALLVLRAVEVILQASLPAGRLLDHGAVAPRPKGWRPSDGNFVLPAQFASLFGRHDPTTCAKVLHELRVSDLSPPPVLRGVLTLAIGLASGPLSEVAAGKLAACADEARLTRQDSRLACKLLVQLARSCAGGGAWAALGEVLRQARGWYARDRKRAGQQGEDPGVIDQFAVEARRTRGSVPFPFATTLAEVLFWATASVERGAGSRVDDSASSVREALLELRKELRSSRPIPELSGDLLRTLPKLSGGDSALR